MVSSTVAALLEDAGSPAAASLDRHSGGSTEKTAERKDLRTCMTSLCAARDLALRPCAVDAGRQNQRARLVIEVILDPKRP